MARGFESKDVEYQQAEAERARRVHTRTTPGDRELAGRRRSIELALSSVRAQRLAATNPHHCRMLDQAIESLEDELSRLV